jgi:CHAD domain-containing protein
MSGEPRLHPDGDVGPALIAIGRDMLAHISLDHGPDATAIHGFRRGMKRWRAFLRLLEPVLGDEAVRLRHEARDLARTLAGARDAQAALDALDDLAGDYVSLSETSMRSLHERIEALRESAEHLTLTPERREELRATLARTHDAIEQWPIADAGFQDVARGLARGYGRARRAMPTDWSRATSEELHEFRGRVVVHRYQMEIVEPLWPRLGRIWVDEAQRLRERLGKHQDLRVLAALPAPMAPLARWRSRLAPAIEARQRDHIETAMRQSGRLFAEKRGAFQRRVEALWESRANVA